MSNNFVGKIGNVIEAPVVVLQIISRKGWKPSRDGVQRDLYLLVDTIGDLYSIVMPHHNAIKIGEGFTIKGSISAHKMFNGQRQTHITAYSLKLKPAKRA